MTRPRLLDLFCGAGGAAVGYHRAGFEVVGVDHKPQKRFPFLFVQTDALTYLAAHGHEFDAVHASPPCQAYSRTRAIWNNNYPDLLAAVRHVLETSGKPWIIENVEEAPLGGIVLCGTQFGLRVLRHRRFESSVFLWAPDPCLHPKDNRCVQVGRPIGEGQMVTVAGNISGVKLAGKAMGIDWMTRDELTQAIPPAYTEFVGKQLRAAL
jgi:DNA (cytosine-5)-methyltransferase 1